MTADDKERTDQQLGRRELLALLSVPAAALSGGIYFLSTNSPAEDDSDGDETLGGDDNDTEDGGGEDGGPDGAESIVDHGAEANPADPGLEEAERNLDAIVDAATAAGDGGAIYVPSGTYFFGHTEDSGPYLDFGERAPPGISIYGDGPEASTLSITGTAPASEQSNQTGCNWSDGYDHGRVEIENIRLDGNYESLGDLREAGGGSVGVEMNGRGELHLYNVYVRGWYMAGVRGGGLIRSARYCTFEENGIGNHNETQGNSISHHVMCRPPRDATFVASRCLFVNCSGSAINIRYNDGNVKVRDCYAEGTGANFMKLSAGRFVQLRNVYHEANTDALEELVDSQLIGANFHGRNFIQSLSERGDHPVAVDTVHVESRNQTDYAFQSRDNRDNGLANIMWTGDMVAIHNSNMVRDNEVIRTRSGGAFSGVSIGRLSVHDSDARIFETDGSDGLIATLNHDRNTYGLGNTGGIEIGTDNAGAEPFEPSVPSRSDVGIDAFEDE